METKQIINWLRDKAARAEELSWQRMLKAAANRLEELDVSDKNVVRKTNADRIRAMSDEKLAHIMVGLSDLDERIGFCAELPECKDLLDTEQGIPASKCVNCMLNWLRKPAEVK